MSVRQNIRDFFHGAAYGQHERELRRQAAELDDFSSSLCYMEIVGLPNPATLYLLDVYPYLLGHLAGLLAVEKALHWETLSL